MPTDNKYPAGRHATWHKPTPRLVRKKSAYPLAVWRASLCTAVVVACKRSCTQGRAVKTHRHVGAVVYTNQTLLFLPRRKQLNVDVNRLYLTVTEVRLHFQNEKESFAECCNTNTRQPFAAHCRNPSRRRFAVKLIAPPPGVKSYHFWMAMHMTAPVASVSRFKMQTNWLDGQAQFPDWTNHSMWPS